MKHFIITIFLAHFLLIAFAQNDVIIEAPDEQVNAGDEIMYPITIYPNGNSIGSFRFQIDYDSTLLQVLNVEPADGLLGFVNDITPGIIIPGLFTSGLEGVDTTFEAVNITFKAIGQAEQISQIELSEGLIFSDIGPPPLNHQFSNGSILINDCDDTLIGTVCQCVGTFQDTDGDGVCDVDDVCPNMDDALIGATCDDADACTTGETYDNNCDCTGGTFQDADGDGVCDADDICPNMDDAIEACSTQTNITDSLALVALYNATDGPNWTNTWNLNQPMNTWYAVHLDGNYRVIELSLYDNQLTGNIPSELGSLDNLKILYLHANQLSGNIPSELGNLSSLEVLYLYHNQLSGDIPSELGSLNTLRQLVLGDNPLSGIIPVQLGNLSNLEVLKLYNNQLTGSIPSELGNLSKMYDLDLGFNQLTNNIPAELGNLSDLIYLNLHTKIKW